MQKITPFFWFDGRAGEAMKFYTSVFKKKARIKSSKHWPKGSGFPEDQVMTGVFTLEGQSFYCMDAGQHEKFTMALSLMVNCKTQKEVDAYYNGLSKGGEKQPCGWVKDKFGVSWQIVPETLMKLMQDKDKAKAGRVMQAMMGMHKIDIAKLKKAYAGR
jgi:predicted 3-demethylubiquinone-9 3-methyltransferase (glyoxalase superfamily)